MRGLISSLVICLAVACSYAAYAGNNEKGGSTKHVVVGCDECGKKHVVLGCDECGKKHVAIEGNDCDSFKPLI